MAELPDLWAGIDPTIQATIRRICEWHVAPVITEDVVLDGSGGSVQLLPTLNLIDIVSITSDGVSVDVSTLEWSRLGMVKLPGVWSSRYRGVRATITHGYGVAPADLRAVEVRLGVLNRMAEAGGSSVRIGQIAVSGGLGDLGYDGLDLRTKALLGPYVLPKTVH